MTDYTQSSYEDFNDSKQNVFWRLSKDEKTGRMIYKRYHANWMIFGDTDSGAATFPPSVVKAYKELNDDEETELGLVAFADNVGAIVNKSFPEFIKNAFNVPDSRMNAVSTAREIVSDKSLLLTKKRYIMHVVNDEGKRVDKLKMMGVQIIRSSSSKFLKDVLMELVNTILDNIDIDGVYELKRKYRQLMYEYDPRDLATPCGTKTLRKYQQQYEETGSMKGVYWSARASMFWNSLCDVMDEPIHAGDRVGTLYIKHHSAKHIAFPIDIVSFPIWFEDIVIDYDVIWEKVDKVIEDYLKSIGLDLKARNTVVLNRLFTFDEV